MIRNLIMAALSAALIVTSTSAMAAQCSGYNEIWSNMAIRLTSGKYMWAKLSCNRNCYEMNVGSNDLNFVGVGTNCGDNMNGYWSVNACDRSKGVTNGPEEIIKEILYMCTR